MFGRMVYGATVAFTVAVAATELLHGPVLVLFAVSSLA